MKFKDLDIALKICHPIIKEEDTPIYQVSESTSDDEYAKIEELDGLVRDTHFVVNHEDDLYNYDSYMVLPFTKHSRRGQFYYFLAHKKTLELSVFASKPDGSGGLVMLPDELIDLIKKGDIVA